MRRINQAIFTYNCIGGCKWSKPGWYVIARVDEPGAETNFKIFYGPMKKETAFYVAEEFFEDAGEPTGLAYRAVELNTENAIITVRK